MAAREPSWGDLRLGITVAAVAAMAGFVVLLAGAQRGPFLPDVYTLYVDLDDAAGIRAGSLVRVAGIDAGEVVDLEIVPAPAPAPVADTLVPLTAADLGPRDIRVELSIHERFRQNITASSRAQLASIGAGGERYVKITAGDVREPPIPPEGEVPTVASIDLDIVVARLARALHEAREVSALTDEIRAKLAAGGGSLGLILAEDAVLPGRIRALQAQSASLMALMDEGEGIIPAMRRDPAAAAGIDSLLASVERITAAFDEGPASPWAEPTELRTAIGELEGSIGELEASLASGRGSLGRFLNDPELSLQIGVLQDRFAEMFAAFAEDPLAFVRIRVF